MLHRPVVATIMKTGLIIGKFLPPHLGHAFLVETASRQVDRLIVLVCSL